MAGGTLRLASRAPRRKLAFRRKPKISKYVRAYVGKRILTSSEVKHLYNYINTTSSTTFAYQALTDTALGTGDTARIGDQIQPKLMDIGFNFGVADTTNILRIFLFQWNLTSTPTDAEMFEDTTNTVTRLCGSLNRDSMKARKMTILWDKQITLNGVSRPNVYFRLKQSLARCRKIGYVGGSTVAVGNIYLGYISDSSAVSHPAIQMAFTFDYWDL